MRIGLGIDTGGTYTDAVIYDFASREILSSAKSLTVREDLTIGINNVLDRLPQDMLRQVRLVSLSTTLATNACVEGKGSRAVIVFIGCDANTVRKYGHEYGLPDYREMIFIDGGHDHNGEIVEEPDWGLLEREVIERSSKADAFGVVQLWGIRNAEFERKASEIIKGATGKNVVCAHELTGELNFMKRAASTLLNAQLIPIIEGFIAAVKASLKERSISAPLVIVRGDGSLMSEEFAKEKPIETLLCGPAASVAGGTRLSGQKDCVIIDMGGTTSDLAVVSGYRVKLANEGAVVGNWRTGTKSIEIKTFGLGGDSLISYSNRDELIIGPVRVAPLSWLASRWPDVKKSIREIYDSKKYHTRSLCEFFYLVRDISDNADYTEEEMKIVQALRNGPLSILALCEAANTTIYEIKLKRLEQLGVILRSGLTPTDIMHLTGDYTGWDEEAARLGAAIMARRLKMSMDTLVKKVNDKVKRELYFNIVKMLLENEQWNFTSGNSPDAATDLIMMAYDKRQNLKLKESKKDFIQCSFTTNFALVGIGAPIHVFLPDVAKVLGTECIIPENASVANAVGAVTGDIVVEESVSIRPKTEMIGITGYYCHSSVGREEFSDYDEALQWALKEAEALARKEAEDRGAGDISIIIETNDNSVDLPVSSIADGEAGGASEDANDNRLVLETVITARATGQLKSLKEML